MLWVRSLKKTKKKKKIEQHIVLPGPRAHERKEVMCWVPGRDQRR